MKVERSRRAKAGMSAERFFTLITDMNNFRLFLPPDLERKFKSDKDSCELTIDPAGTLRLQVSERNPFSRVSYTGSAAVRTGVNLDISIAESGFNSCDVDLLLSAETDPFTGMFLSSAVDRLLDRLVSEIENYTGREFSLSKENQLP